MENKDHRNTLYVSDMDGTLLGSDSLVSRHTAGIISDLTRRGALITVATARTPATVVPLLADTLTTPPAIVMTGAAQWIHEPGEFSNVHFIPRRDLDIIAGVCLRYDIHPFVYSQDTPSFLNVYHAAGTMNQQEAQFYETRRHLTLKRFHLGIYPPDLSRIMLCYAVGDHRRMFAAADELKQCAGISLTCYYDIFNKDVAHLELQAAGVSKAAAVLALKASLGVERVVVFGDNLNDLPMLAAADYAVAVGNAFDEVKESADVVIGPNTEDSVARFILEDWESRRG